MSAADIALQGLIGEDTEQVALAQVLGVGGDGRSVRVQRGTLTHEVRRLDSYKPSAGDRAILLRLSGGEWVLIGALA